MTLATSVGVSALNRLLGREAWATQRLSRHSGKTVRLALGQTTVSLTILNDGLVQVADASIVPDVTLTLPAGQISQILEVVRHSDPERLVDAMHIQGDAGLANVVADLARNLRWDAESDVARVVGDIPAARLMSGARKLSQGLKQAGERFVGNVSEYITEEEPMVLGREGLIVWQLDYGHLVHKIDQLDHRLARLESALRSRGL